jgi:4-hydroxy-tetrahydrodipicolinate synthase
MMSVGATGVISVLSNIMPKPLKSLYNAFLIEHDIQKAMNIHTKLMPLFQGMFIETNPIPIKEAMAYMGLLSREFRLPLCPLSDANSASMKRLLIENGLLKKSQ